MQKYRASKVFVPGGLPEFTYNPRSKYRLEDRLKEVNDNLCKLVMITGLTKSGKTVLTKNVFPRDSVLWFDGGSFTEEEDFWSDLVNQLDAFTSYEESKERENTSSFEGEVEGKLGVPLVAQGKLNFGSGFSQSNSNSLTKSRQTTSKIAAITSLREKKIPLIIDDFHYIRREEQGLIVRALKPLIFEALPVIFIAIPHRRLDAVRVEKEMTSRVETIAIPPWDIDELVAIPKVGFPLLNINISEKVMSKLANESFGSPHLMQEFCREICRKQNIEETCEKKIIIADDIDLINIFKTIAQNTGRVMFEKLAKGPRQRTDRIKRTLKDGTVTDIYGVVLRALAEMRPGIQTIDYEDLRNYIKSILKDNVPQAHEVSRVFEQMAKISANDEASSPVIDWEKEERKLHITDPFFAYFLRWGVN